jgi:N-acetylneuraminic acid mutarotase
VVNGKIYAIGGLTVNAALSTVEEYDPKADTWTKKANMPTPRGDLCTAVVDNKIYAIGGVVLPVVNKLSTVEEYDSTTDTWTRKANMPTARQSFSTTVVNGKIYAIGGVTQFVALSTVEEYDPVTDTWTTKANMPTPRAGLSTSAVNGKIYVIGGFSDIGKAPSTVEVYDPVADRWTKGAHMPTPRGQFAISVVNGKIYVIGGVIATGGKYTAVSKVEVYHPATDRWTEEKEMPTRRGWNSANTVDGKIYVIGGSPVYMPGVSDILSTVEELDTGYAVNAKDNLPTLWGKIKHSR